MHKLAELLHLERPRLQAFANHLEERFRADFSNAHYYDPIYSIKSRIKTYASIESKLRALANPKSGKRDEVQSRRASQLLYEDLNSLSELFPVCHDVVGIRIVWFFNNAQVEATERLIRSQDRPHWFGIKNGPHGMAVKRIPLFVENNEADSVIKRFETEPYPSGYTSTHILGTISDQDPAAHRFSDLWCELQMRSLLEEAWGEISHYLSYKGIKDSNTEQDLKQRKLLMAVVDIDFERLCKKAKILRSHRIHPHLQLSHNYPLNTQGAIPQEWCDRFRSAYEFRLQGKYGDSLKALQSLESTLNTEIHLKYVNKLRRRILSDIAACYLHKRSEENIALAVKAIETAKSTTPPDSASSFWANLRMAEVHRIRREYGLAVEACKVSLSRLHELSQPVTLCSTWGLEADVQCFLSSVYWSDAYNTYKKRFRSKAAKQFTFQVCKAHLNAIKCAKAAYDLARASIETSLEVKARSISCLLHLLAWKDEQRQYVGDLFGTIRSTDHFSPSDLGKLAWCLIVGMTALEQKEATLQAGIYCQDAILLTENQSPGENSRLQNALHCLQTLIDRSRSENNRVVRREEWLELIV